MPALSFAPAIALLTHPALVAPTRPLRTLLRTAGYKLRPPRPRPHAVLERRSQAAVLASGTARADQLATVLVEERPGPVPTIVLGGFVPDATEQVYLLRGAMLRQGSVYYLNYPSAAFSTELLAAQLDDLVRECAVRHGRPPVVFAVSFGAGLAIEWLRHARVEGREPALRGLVLVSPVACTADVIAPGEAKPSTLLGRALQPWLSGGPTTPAMIEKSRAVFAKMFEAGAQNKAAIKGVLTRAEVIVLRERVLGTIARIDPEGASQRVHSLRAMPSPAEAVLSLDGPLTSVPTLVLYAEKEGAVLTESSPTRFLMENGLASCFPQGRTLLVANRHGAPVQHASLIFHAFNFLPPIVAFYRKLRKPRQIPRAA